MVDAFTYTESRQPFQPSLNRPARLAQALRHHGGRTTCATASAGARAAARAGAVALAGGESGASSRVVETADRGQAADCYLARLKAMGPWVLRATKSVTCT